MSHRVSVEVAREYFAHPSQLKGSYLDSAEDLPAEGAQYWANGDVLGIFHIAPWPGVWMGHYAVKPTAWGNAVRPARAILNAFQDAERPDLIMGWTPAHNRAAVAFVRRLGFVEHGRFSVPEGEIIEQSWRP